MIFDWPSRPVWLDGGRRFWYWTRARSGRSFWLVDAATGTKRPAFDRRRLAKALREQGASEDLAIEGLRLTPSEPERMGFHLADGSAWQCDLASYACRRTDLAKRPSRRGSAGVPCPDGSMAAFVRGGDVWVRDTATGGERRLTTGGNRTCGYGAGDGFGAPLPAALAWSPDGRRLIALRVDRRGLPRFHLIRSARADEGPRPELHSYPYVLPGDERVPLVEVVCLEAETGRATVASVGPLPCVMLPAVWWSDDGERIHFVYHVRGFAKAQLWAMDPSQGSAALVMEEGAEDRVDLNAFDSVTPVVRVLARTREIVWFSRRDGWGHLYLYDLDTATLKNRITHGPWVVHDIAGVDEAQRWVYFVAGGREPGRDPYYRHLYRVRLDGSELQLLTPENADHTVSMAPDCAHFVDRYSRVDATPVAVLRRSDGALVAELQRADLARLRKFGWRPPEPFTVKARDGETDIFGVMFQPSRLDPAKRYPVVDDIYPGPHCIHTPKSLPAPQREADDGRWLGEEQVFWRAQAMAELGFVVVIMDGLGTPGRSKGLHDISYQNLANAGGLADHVAGLRQLARTRPYMDLDRVGIYGISAGGYAAARALLTYPEFYKVGVSVAGNHDPRRGKASWIERYFGLRTPENEALFTSQRNVNLAPALQGKLLLVHGDVDDNVHPAQTYELLHAFIKANKDVDLLILPNRRHDVRNDPYFVRKLWDYFVTNLQGQQPPHEYPLAGLGRAGS